MRKANNGVGAVTEHAEWQSTVMIQR